MNSTPEEEEEEEESRSKTTATPSELPAAGTEEQEMEQVQKQQQTDNTSMPAAKKHKRRKSMERGLSVQGMSMRIPAHHDAEYTAAETHGFDHWKTKALHFLHSDPVQYTLMALLLLDVAILFVELFLQATYPLCHTIERDAISCCPNLTADNAQAVSGSAAESEHLRRILAEDEHHNLCGHSAIESYEYEATCDPHKWEEVHRAEKILFALTITILSGFLFELTLMMLILQRAFFSQLFYVLDFFIVATSLALEILFKTMDEDALISVAGLLVFGRIWRFVRIGHGLVEVTADYAHKDKEALLHYAEAMEELLQKNQMELPKESHRVKHIKRQNSAHHS